MELNKLMVIEDKIESCYITLANLEASGKRMSWEYEECFSILYNLINEEKNLLNNLDYEEIIEIRKQVLKYCNQKESSLSLGYLTNSIYWRILHILEVLLGSESFNYATYLRYDLNQLIFPFLDSLGTNDNYKSIRNDLIFYRYNLIFMNLLNENDFLNMKDNFAISIETKNFKTDDNLDLIYVDKSILILEGREYISFIDKLSDDFRDNPNEYALAVIAVLELLARLILSENEILHYLQQDFEQLMQSDGIPEEIRNLIQEMIMILAQFKDKIGLAR